MKVSPRCTNCHDPLEKGTICPVCSYINRLIWILDRDFFNEGVERLKAIQPRIRTEGAKRRTQEFLDQVDDGAYPLDKGVIDESSPLSNMNSLFKGTYEHIPAYIDKELLIDRDAKGPEADAWNQKAYLEIVSKNPSKLSSVPPHLLTAEICMAAVKCNGE